MPIPARRVSILHRLPFQKIYFSPNEGAGTPAAGQAPAAGSGQDPQTPPAAGGTPQGQASGGGKSAEEYERELTALRSENAGHRTKNKELEKFKTDAETAALSETDKFKKQATDAETKATLAQERVLKSEIKLAAKAADIVDPDAAVALLDKSKIKFDADGEPTNLAELMKELATTKPYLLAAQGGTGHSSTNPGGGGRGSGLTLAQLKLMTPQQVAALPAAEVNRVLAAGK